MKANRLKIYLCSCLFILISNFAIAGALDYIDVSIPPQQDFYQHANGGWLANSDRCGIQHSVEQEIQKKVNICLDKTIAGSLDSYMKNTITQLYKSLTSEKIIITRSIRREFLLIDKMTKKTDIPLILGHLNSIGVPAIVETKLTYSTKSWGFALIGGSSQVQSIPTEKEIKSLFEKFSELEKGDHTINSRTATKIKMILDNEQKINILFKNPDSKQYMNFPIDNIPKSVEPWLGYLETAELIDKTYVIYNLAHFKAVNDLLLDPEFSLDDWKAYLKFQFLHTYQNALTTMDKTQAYQQIQNIFNYELPGICFSEDIDANIKEVKTIIFNIKRSYEFSINSTSWLSKSTINNATKRLENISVAFAYPPELKEKFNDKELSNDDPIANLIAINIYHYNQLKINRVGTLLDEATAWTAPVSMYTPAVYKPGTHTIVIPLKYFLPPFFSPYNKLFSPNSDQYDYNNALNYASLGFTFAHELSHALELPRFSKDKSEIEQFNTISNKLISQGMSTQNTLQEDMADILGLDIAYRAYNQFVLRGAKAPVFNIILPNTQPLSITSKQLFYYSFAERWRKGDSKCVLQKHSTNYDRVNNTLKNQDGFEEAFKAQPGDKMYLPPDQRIRIWGNSGIRFPSARE
ncbi:MAG: Peptidase [Burkholderiales bacterium]|jgi:predicted metalloendopeptidase|nr:Peptidase [Burkholderiales bacterium]